MSTQVQAGASEERPAGKGVRMWKLLLLQLVLWPLLLLAAELGYRGWLAASGSGYDADETRVELRRRSAQMLDDLPQRLASRDSAAASKISLHPYTGFVPNFLYEAESREARKLEQAPENEYRILILGGSVAAGFANNSGAGVARLTELLGADPLFAGRPLRVLAHGYGSFKQPQQLNLASYLFAIGRSIDLVINLDGFNEVALTMRNADQRVNPIFPSFGKWGHLTSDWNSNTSELLALVRPIQDARGAARALTSRAERWGVHRSALLGRRTLNELRAIQGRYGIAVEKYQARLRGGQASGGLRWPNFDDDTASVLALSVKVWEECSRSLAALCEPRGIEYFHFLQPTLHDEGSKQLTDSEVETGTAHPTWIQGAREGYPLLRETGARLAEDGIQFVDTSLVFAETAETLYYDACHFNQVGNAILGEAIAEAILARLDADDE